MHRRSFESLALNIRQYDAQIRITDLNFEYKNVENGIWSVIELDVQSRITKGGSSWLIYQTIHVILYYRIYSRVMH